MNCHDLEELLSAYADGELPRTQREFIEEHLSGCAACRETLANFQAAGRRLSSLRESTASSDMREATLSKIKAINVPTPKAVQRWWRLVAVASAALAIIAVLLVVRPWGTESPEAMAAEIVSSSPEVQAAVNGQRIETVEVTTKVIDSENNVLLALVKTEDRAVAAEVNLKTKRVTEVIRVDIPEFQPGDEQKAIGIARADPRVQELLAQGGVLDETHLIHTVDITQIIGPDGAIRKEGTVTPTAFMSVELDGKEWNILVAPQEGKVLSIRQAQPSDAMIVAHISRFVTRFVAPALLLLGILLVSGLSFGHRRAKTIAGTAALMLGIIGLFMSLYSLSSIWWQLVLSVGIPAVGLIIGIADLRQRSHRRRIPITGIVLCSLALLLVFSNAIMLNINNVVPGENIVRVIGIAAVIAAIIAYAFKENIMSTRISGMWLRPAAVVLAAVVVLIVVILQPWSTSPEGVIAKAYSATEGLLSYRTSGTITTTYQGETSVQSSAWEYAAPDRRHGYLNLGMGTFEFTIIGDKQYVRESDNASGKIYILATSDTSHSTEDTLRILDSLAVVRELPDETIDGVNCLHLQGEVDMRRQAERAKTNLDSDYPASEEAAKSIDEQLAAGKETVELWIGKEDYLIRQVKRDGQMPSDDGGLDTFSSTAKYYDFNEPISIEPPLDADGQLLPGWELRESLGSNEQVFRRTITSSIGAQEGYDDQAHQEVRYTITITNKSSETVKDVRVTIATRLTEEMEDRPMVAAEPEMPADAIGPGESWTFHASCPFDATGYTEEEILELPEVVTFLIDYITQDGRERTQLIYSDAPYPTKTPPDNPPGG